LKTASPIHGQHVIERMLIKNTFFIMQDLQNVLPVLILVLTDIYERLIEFGGSQQQENATNFESKIVRLC
jgi:hypothetical protein